MSMLTFDRTDITQTAQAERGTMEVLPLSKGKRQNKIVLGDADGVVQALGMRKGEDTRSSVFKTRLGSDPIASLTLGAGKGQEDKIFVASGATVRGVNKKGKEFFKFSTNLTERIEDVRVDGVDMWATGEYFSNQFSDCADAHFFASNERIADARVAPVVLASEKNPILACRDRFVRVVQGSELYYEAAVAGAASALHVCERNDARRREHRDEAARETVDTRAPKPSTHSEKRALPPDFEHASRREVLFGTEQGLCGQLFLDGERVARGWVIDTNASRRAGAGGVSAIHAECDLTGDGRADVVIGRDDGSIETYAFDENGEPALAGRVACGEAVQTLRHGRVTTPFPEILAHTFSGKVLSFRPGADSTSADGFGMGEALDDAQAAARRFAEKRRVDDVRLETERLAAEVQVARAKYAELSGDLIAADGPSRVLDRFRLDAETATHRLTLEAPAAIESVAVHVSSARVDLLDEYGAGAEAFFSREDAKKGAGTSAPRSAASGNATAAIVSRTPPELCQKVHGAPGALAVYRLPSENQTRFEIEMRCQEGAPGAIRACVIPRRPPKTVREVVREVKPLCLHRRVLTETLVSESDGAKNASSEDARSLVLGAGRVAEALTATGDFLAEDAHQWVAELLDDVPNTLAGDSFSYDFENALLGTRLRVAGTEGEASFWSDGATPLALIKAHVGKRAAKTNLRVRFAFDGDDATPATFARRVHPLILETIRLARSNTLLEGLRELKMQEPELDRFLSPEYAAVLAEEKSVAAEASARRGRLAYLVGVVKDFFVDWHAFRGENVKKDMHEVDAVFSRYALEKMVETLERRAR
jgi:Bardet-Biedl syndrome 7 protein